MPVATARWHSTIKEPMTRRSRELTASQLVTRYWVPALAYIGVIFFISAQPNLRPPQPFANVDKVYHLIEYGILGLVLVRAFYAAMPRQRPLVLALLALSLGVIVGTCDELFQASVPGRISSGFDLLADTTGLALAQILFLIKARDPIVDRD